MLWVIKKHGSISLTTAKGDYIFSTPYCMQILWMKETLKYIQVKLCNPIPIMSDKASAINISKNPSMHSKTKHIPMRYHFLREWFVGNILKLVYVATKEQLTDIFTMSLIREPFEYVKKQIGVVTPPSK